MRNFINSTTYQLPEVGEVLECKVNIWRYGKIISTEIIVAEYIGFNKITNKLMFNIDTYNEAYIEVIDWKYIKDKGEIL